MGLPTPTPFIAPSVTLDPPPFTTHTQTVERGRGLVTRWWRQRHPG